MARPGDRSERGAPPVGDAPAASNRHPERPSLDLIGRRKRRLYYALSLVLLVPGIVSLLIPPGLRLAVDFTGGTLWELQFERPVAPGEVLAVLAEHGYGDAIVQTAGADGILVRAKEIPSEGPTKAAVADDLRRRGGAFAELRFESVGPTVGQETAGRAALAVAVASLAILAYLAWSFRKVDHPLRYGVCAVVALLHDALLLLGVFSLLGRLFFVEVDALFLTAVLTVIGFSVHDTIVVFDRVRENAVRMRGQPFEQIVNHSLAQTLGRSLATSVTIAFTTAALVLFGGETIRLFALALLIGVVSGTYSSIFNAAALLVSWENGELRLRPPARAA